MDHYDALAGDNPRANSAIHAISRLQDKSQQRARPVSNTSVEQALISIGKWGYRR